MLDMTEIDGFRLIEGRPDGAPVGAERLVEACLSAGVEAALLYPANLAAGFFDLSTGEAGAVLQKLANYRIRLAVVCESGSVSFSSRFGEVVAEERRRKQFGLFGTRREALDWLASSLPWAECDGRP